MGIRDEITAQLEENSRLNAEMAASSEFLDAVERLVRLMAATYRSGGKTILFGNGGNAATAEHIAGELVGRMFNNKRPALPALCLTDSGVVVSAIGNDFSFGDVFRKQVEAHVKPGDLVIGVSSSGNSPNMLAALSLARKLGATTVGFTGGAGGKVVEVADCVVCIPTRSHLRIQDAQLTVGHTACELLERELFDEEGAWK